MNDRELLELAAKAAGIDYWIVRFAPRANPIESFHVSKNGETVEWSPLTDDGDALRLAVTLGIAIYPPENALDDPTAHTDKGETGSTWLTEHRSGDPYAATRRAITRAAAEIGKAMP